MRQEAVLRPPWQSDLVGRLGRYRYEERLRLQAARWAGDNRIPTLFDRLKRFLPIFRIIRWSLYLSGLSGRGRRNYLDVKIVQRRINLPGWPVRLSGFRLLHLSDLHLDLDPCLTGVVRKLLEGLVYDLVVITGDFRDATTGGHRAAMLESSRLLSGLPVPVFGVLGNHDFIEKVPWLEQTGVRILLNEGVVAGDARGSFYLAGVDDPTYYRMDDWAAAARGWPNGLCGLALAHGPDSYQAAAECGFALYLCGHTHGGQICLPGGRPLLRHRGCPEEMLSGGWRYGAMHGYTSRGTGSCRVAARFFCPPEVTVHHIFPEY